MLFIDGHLLVNERIEVGLEPNKPRIIMEVDPKAAKIVLTESISEDLDEYYILLIAGKHPKYDFKSAGIMLKEGEHKSLTLSPE